MLDQVVVNSVEGKLKAVRDADLVEDVMQVIFDRLFANEEVFANFLVPVALSDQQHDLPLFRGR